MLAPVEVKVALVLIIAAAITDRLKKSWESSRESYEYSFSGSEQDS